MVRDRSLNTVKHQTLTILSYASPGGDAGSWTLGLQAGRGKGVRAAADYLPGKFYFKPLLLSSITTPGFVAMKLSPLVASSQLHREQT